MLKVYVNPLSGPSNNVLFGLHAMDVDYARVTVNLAQGEQRERFAVPDPASTAQVDLSSYAHLSAWLARVTAMHFYTKTHAHYGAGILDRG